MGLTPLMAAAAAGFTGIGSLLLDRGVNVNSRPDCCGQATALTVAAASGHLDFVKMLLQRSAPNQGFEYSSVLRNIGMR